MCDNGFNMHAAVGGPCGRVGAGCRGSSACAGLRARCRPMSVCGVVRPAVPPPGLLLFHRTAVRGSALCGSLCDENVAPCPPLWPAGHPLALRANSVLSLHSWHARAARMGRGRAAWGDTVRPAGCRVRGAVRSGGAWSPGARTLFSHVRRTGGVSMRPGVPAHDRDISPVTYDGRRRCHNSRMF